MANKHIDLSEFLSGPNPPKKGKSIIPIKPAMDPQHVTCTQCHGKGKHVITETHTPELSEKAEELLADLGKVLPVQQKLETEVICKRCAGAGHHFLADDVRAKRVTLFWTRSKCRCGACYEGPAHQNSCTIQNHVYRPIIIDGKLFGWRYKETTYVPSQVLPMHATLPMEIEYFDYQIEACRKCIREHVVICLPHVKESA